MNLLVTGGAGFVGSNVIQHIIDRSEIEELINLECLTSVTARLTSGACIDTAASAHTSIPIRQLMEHDPRGLSAG